MALINGLGLRTQQTGNAEESSAPAASGPAVLHIGGPELDYSNLVSGPGRAEAIDGRNDPTRFGVQLETKIDRLALKGQVKQRPWADTYWPTYQDGVNHRWQTTGDFKKDLSPAEKFDAA